MHHYQRPIVAVAPMMDWTDRHCRVFHRQLTRSALLYSEMLTADAVLFGDRDRLLGFDPAEHPVALQLGGNDPAKLAEAAAIGVAWGYDEINLNVGCPSDRVQGGHFGACLMADPALVGRCIDAMARAVAVPVTVKCRIGIDDQDPEPALDALADAVLAAGAAAIWVHARKAWLEGLSPAQNRDLPPLDYARVQRLKDRLPDAFIGLNGGILALDAVRAHLRSFDGVMLGRAAYRYPALLCGVDGLIDGVSPAADPFEAAAAMVPYVRRLAQAGIRPAAAVRHMLGLFHGQPGARAWRRHLTVGSVVSGADERVLVEALEMIATARRLAPIPAHAAA